jgi:hypothetical protein
MAAEYPQATREVLEVAVINWVSRGKGIGQILHVFYYQVKERRDFDLFQHVLVSDLIN